MRVLFVAALFTILSANLFGQDGEIGSAVFHWNDLEVNSRPGREYRKILQGSTPEFSFFEIHATTLLPDGEARLPHTQKDIEELIIVKEGTLTCMLDGDIQELTAGSVVLIPPGVEQSMSNLHDQPLTYYVIMFKSIKPMDLDRSNKAGGALMLEAKDLVYVDKGTKGAIQYFNRPTANCENFEMHITKLKTKGPSHNPHTHIDTEIILVNEGMVTMNIDGQVYDAGPGDLIIVKSQSLHGVANAGDEACAYFAFKWR